MGDGTGYNEFITSISEGTLGTSGETYPIAMSCSNRKTLSYSSIFEGLNSILTLLNGCMAIPEYVRVKQMKNWF